MRFFHQIHRSIFDPSFYCEIDETSWRPAIFHAVKLLLLAALVAGAARTCYLFDSSRGIVAPLAEAFSGIEIKNGTLSSARPLSL